MEKNIYTCSREFIDEHIRLIGYGEGLRDGIIKGQEQAWNCAKELWGNFNTGDLYKMFGTHNLGTVFENETPQNAVSTVEKYKKNCNKKELKNFKVGDEVINVNGNKGYVTKIDLTDLCVLYPDGRFERSLRSVNSKTGRHCDEIESVLEKLRSEAE